MSLFAPNDSGFAPLFRLLDDFDTYRSDAQPGAMARKGQHGAISARTFNPKFDLRETENTYELHGELPGIDRENVTIEFTEAQTIVIRGNVERTYQSGTPPDQLLEGNKMSGAITEGGEQHNNKSHKVTVEDEEAERAKEQQGTVAKKEDPKKFKEKYWISERSIGEFSRTFSFPQRIDQEGVSASLKDGILNISIPKARKHESRRININ